MYTIANPSIRLHFTCIQPKSFQAWRVRVITFCLSSDPSTQCCLQFDQSPHRFPVRSPIRASRSVSARTFVSVNDPFRRLSIHCRIHWTIPRPITMTRKAAPARMTMRGDRTEPQRNVNRNVVGTTMTQWGRRTPPSSPRTCNHPGRNRPRLGLSRARAHPGLALPMSSLPPLLLEVNSQA